MCVSRRAEEKGRNGDWRDRNDFVDAQLHVGVMRGVEEGEDHEVYALLGKLDGRFCVRQTDIGMDFSTTAHIFILSCSFSSAGMSFCLKKSQ